MAVTPSTMVQLGTPAASFTLPDVTTGNNVSLESIRGKAATVILFICNHCPYVKHINDELVNVASDYQRKDVHFIGISSNDAEKYPQDGPEEMKKTAQELGYPFPYLYDESQRVARAYDAACTPDIFVYDKNLRLAYRGQLDDSRPANALPVTGKDLREALDALLDGRPVASNQIPSIGCNIKWR